MAITEGRKPLTDLTDKELREGFQTVAKNVQYAYQDYDRELSSRKQARQREADCCCDFGIPCSASV